MEEPICYISALGNASPVFSVQCCPSVQFCLSFDSCVCPIASDWPAEVNGCGFLNCCEKQAMVDSEKQAMVGLTQCAVGCTAQSRLAQG